jgi:small subunit ribosomal protein S21
MNSLGKSVIVNDGNIERALRKLKKKIENSGLLFELKEREHHVKATTQRKLKASAAKKRWQKYLRSQQLPPKLF